MLKRCLSILTVAAMLFAFAWVLTGCGGSGGASGTGSIKVSLVDAPLDADEVNVSIKSVQVHESSKGWTTIKEFDTPLEVNLLDYRTGGNSLLLAESPLDAGHYTMIRLMLTAAEVVVGAQSYDVDIKNVEQTGVKCNGEFDVQSGQLMALILDFNAGRSFVNTGNNTYKLHPVMTMSPVNVASELTGKVELKDGETVLPIPENLIVNVYKNGHIAGDLPVSSTNVTSDGTFRFAILVQGTYDIEVAQGQVQPDETITYTSLYTQQGVVVTAPSTDMGTITINTATPAP
ncbi:MAG: DUF4382 domain-containing protein [Armatimonadota bacterium]